MFTDVLDEDWLSHFSNNSDQSSIMSKAIKMDTQSQINLGVFTKIMKDGKDSMMIMD